MRTEYARTVQLPAMPNDCFAVTKAACLADFAVCVKPVTMRAAAVELIRGLHALASSALLGGHSRHHDQWPGLPSGGCLAIDQASNAAGRRPILLLGEVAEILAMPTAAADLHHTMRR